MTSLTGPGHPLRKLFSGLVEQVFQVDIGICDPLLTDYLGDLLADFIHVDRIYPLRTANGDVIRDLSRLEAEANLGPAVTESRRRRFINKYVGDFTLFWTGVYPENLRAGHQGGVDLLEPYVATGKRSYGIAGELTGDGDEPPANVLLQLSEQFEFCVHGLHLVRVEWERLSQSDRQN